MEKGNLAVNFISAFATDRETDNFSVGSSLLSEFGILGTMAPYRILLRLFNSFLANAGAAVQISSGEKFLTGHRNSDGYSWGALMVLIIFFFPSRQIHSL